MIMSKLILPLFFVISGCSLQRIALRTTTPIFETSSDVIMKEGNWDMVKEAAPANLKFLEVLWENDKSNFKLLPVIIKSYSGYGFSVLETLALDDELRGVEHSRWKKQAIDIYTRAFDYGLLYLNHRNISNKDLLANDEEILIKKIKKLDEDDVIALLYTAQSWGSLINLQKDNVALVSQVSKVKILFDRVCEIDPGIDGNVCDLFYAQYYVSRPKMLGGDPEKGQKLFTEAIKKYPHNLLMRTSYIQYYLIPSIDVDKYEEEAKVLKQEFLKWSDQNRDNLENRSPYKDFQEFNLYNSIANKRFQIIENHKKKIF
jgi:hypothetical protein